MTATALITGATSGIGASFARVLAARGYNLILTGRRDAAIRALAEDIGSRHRVSVSVIIAELSEAAGIDSVARRICDDDTIEILVNNAGFGTYDEFHAADIAEHRRMVAVHVGATVELTHAVLPQMLRRGGGSIVNVSSISSWCPAPKSGVYAGTKSFLVPFSESLHMELRDRGIRVQALCPGFTRTDFHARIDEIQADMQRIERFPWMSPDDVVEASLKALDKNRVVCIPGFRNRLIARLARVVPRAVYYRVVR